MIKSILLNQRSKLFGHRQSHGTYKEAASIGILYNADEFGKDIISDLMTIFKGDQKTTSQLGYSDKAQEEDRFIFTKKDISSTGMIKKDSISFFIKQKFDFLLSLDHSENINFKYILATCKANCKVGLETDSYKDLLLMSIKPEAEETKSAQNLVKYLKMI